MLQHDYKLLYEFEINNRKQFFYPPFARLIQLTFRHKQNHIAEEAANILTRGLQQEFRDNLTGPAQNTIPRIRNKYLWNVLIRLPKDSATIKQCKDNILQQVALLNFTNPYKSVDVLIDVDPY